jgi:hypothetical protein
VVFLSLSKQITAQCLSTGHDYCHPHPLQYVIMHSLCSVYVMSVSLFIRRRTTGWILMKISLDIKPLEAAPIS